MMINKKPNMIEACGLAGCFIIIWLLSIFACGGLSRNMCHLHPEDTLRMGAIGYARSHAEEAPWS